MIKSMTGFGRGENTDNIHSIEIEIKTVNHRYNDIFIRMPKHLNYLEENMKKIIKEKLSRGRIEVFVKLEYNEGSALDVNVDLPLAKAYKNAILLLQEELDINNNIEISDILEYSEVIKLERLEVDEDQTWITLKGALNNAIDEVLVMRENEGKLLSEDIVNQIEKIENYLVTIKDRSKYVVDEYKKKLEDRIEELLEKEFSIDEEKLANEIVFFVDRSDINEEVVRFESHIDQLMKTLKSKDAVGRRLDFLIQEINREINTIGSKSSDIEISQEVVNIKSEIEKIREQVQNIE